VSEPTLDFAGAVAALTTLGVLPVILLAAILGIASVMYRRFRR
jgi:hypothetical protein